MCGRYTLTIDKRTIEKRFGAKFYIAQPSVDWALTFNAAPSQLLPIIRTHHDDRIEVGKWGFVREDWNSAHIRPQNNARLETAATKPMFASSFFGRHCLVLADSFYEWKTVGTHKQPYRIMLKTGEPFAMAGIYARGHDHEFGDAENTTVTFAILTTTANEIMQPIHERMPVILPLDREKNWLPPNPSGMVVFPPFPSELMTAYPVTAKMNKASFNTPEAIRPLEPAR